MLIPQHYGVQIKMMQTLIKDCQRLFKERFEASTKIINNYLAAHQQTFSSLELTTICLGQNKILSSNLSQLYWWLVFGKLDIDLKTYEFSCYTANMCYDPRQFWPTPTKDSYFPLRKLDLKRFAEATKTIWINNWIRLQGQTSSQLSKVLSRQDFTKIQNSFWNMVFLFLYTKIQK